MARWAVDGFVVREILDGVTLGIFLQQCLLLGRVGGGIF